MPKTLLTTNNIAFIRKNRLNMSASEMARKFGIDKSIVGRYMRKNGLSAPKDVHIKFRALAIVGKTTSTPAIDRELKKYYLTIPVKTLATKIKKSHTFVVTRLRQLGLIIPEAIIQQRKIDSQLKPGNVSHNKGKKMPPEVYEKCKSTMFKKGQLPKNTAEKNGTISIRHEQSDRSIGPGRAYKYIRISLGVWVPLHIHRWEKKRGPIPKGHCLWFKDGNSLNCTLKNLELITRGENVRRNHDKFLQYPTELKQTINIINKINKKLKQHGQSN